MGLPRLLQVANIEGESSGVILAMATSDNRFSKMARSLVARMKIATVKLFKASTFLGVVSPRTLGNSRTILPDYSGSDGEPARLALGLENRIGDAPRGARKLCRKISLTGCRESSPASSLVCG